MYDLTLPVDDLEACGRCPACCRGEEAFLLDIGRLEEHFTNCLVRMVVTFPGPDLEWVPEMVQNSCKYFKQLYYKHIRIPT